MDSIESLKMYQMYLEKKKLCHKTDIKKTAIENLSEYVLIGLEIDKVSNMIEYLEDCCYWGDYENWYTNTTNFHNMLSLDRRNLILHLC